MRSNVHVDFSESFIALCQNMTCLSFFSRKRSFTRLIFLLVLQPLLALEYMGQLVGLMYCSMGGQFISNLIGILYRLQWYLSCSYPFRFVFHFSNMLPILQHCAKVAYHCSRFTYHSLVPAAMCAFTAIVCHGWPRNNWSPSSGSPQFSKLHNLLDYVRLGPLQFFHLSSVFYI